MLLVILLVGLLLLGFPIYVSLGLVTLIFMWISKIPLTMLVKSLYSGADQYPLVAVTGFILVGYLFEKAGITEEIVNLVKHLMGSFKAGLAVITIVSCAVFAAVSGSGPATVATIGGLMIPAMLKSGYTPQFAGAVAVSGGALGILIPPSNPFLMYGIIARQSIAKLFLAGFVPGIIMTAALSCTAVLVGKTRHGIHDVSHDEHYGRLTFSRACKAIYGAKWALFAILLLLGGIYAGLFTPIEAAEVTIFYTLFVGLFITRKMKFSDISNALTETVVLSGTLIILVAASTAFGRLITLNQIPTRMGTALQSVSDNPTVILFVIMGIMIFVGTWAETFSQIVVLTPIFLPIILRLNIDPIHFGVLFVVCAEIGFLTPPFGANLFVGMKLANLSLETMSKSVLPYILCYILVLALLVLFPSLSTFLPNLVFGK